MGGDAGVVQLGIVGRERELRLVRDAVHRAAEGVPCAVFVHGEAGVGKTVLARTIAAEAQSQGMAVLWGQGLRFGSTEATYLPLVMALEGWLRRSETGERGRVLGGVSGVHQLLPSFGDPADPAPTRLLQVVDAVLSRIVELRPTLLVIDDAQWADAATCDALSYLVAGFEGQRLAVVMTYRDDGLTPGHPMLGWAADLRRLDGVRDLGLQRLTQRECAALVQQILGEPPEPRLMAEVMRRTAGNPYLTELLLEGVEPTAQRLPRGVPAALQEAVLATWHRLSEPARWTMQALAVAGGPVRVDDLGRVASRGRTEPVDPEPLLLEAIGLGVVVDQGDGVWFRHPLTSELIAPGVPAERAQAWHRAWAEVIDARGPRTGLDELRRLGLLALHLEEAGEANLSLEVALRAADLARERRSPREEAVHLRRAMRLWARAARSVRENHDQTTLLERLLVCCRNIGDTEDALSACDRLVEVLDPEREPLRLGRVLMRQADLRWFSGRTEDLPTAAVRRAVELARDYPDSEEYAEALAWLSDCLVWEGDLMHARRIAAESVEAARRSGSEAALSAAYGARAFPDSGTDAAGRDSEKSLALARRTGRSDLVMSAVGTRLNHYSALGMLEASAGLLREALLTAQEEGLSAPTVGLAGMLAHTLLDLGRVREAGEVIRQGLAPSGVAHGLAYLRLAATAHAVRRGNDRSADLHVARARELIPTLEERSGLVAPPRLAEYLVSSGRAGEALAMLSRTMPSHLVDLRVVDSMLLWGARAAADLAQQARDRMDVRGAARARGTLLSLVDQRIGLAGSAFPSLVESDAEAVATRAVFLAETQRCRGRRGAEQWREAESACAAAGLRWEENLASLRVVEELVDERSARHEVGRRLREVHRYATEQGTRPLWERAEGLSRLLRVSLVEPELPPQRHASAGRTPLDALTPREHEVLGHLSTGRTYAEIAAHLFISEKTVSVHVSNLLRKTGSSSRREVVELAVRLGMPSLT